MRFLIVTAGSRVPRGSGTDSSAEVAPTEPSGPSAPSDGTDTSASGSETDEASFNWLMLLIGLLMLLGLMRALIRGRKKNL